MKERDIIYENGQYWVMKYKDLYYVMKTGFTHSTSDDTAYKELDIAITYVDYLERQRINKILKGKKQ